MCEEHTIPEEQGADSGLTVWLALAANVGITVAKFVGFVVTGSASLLAEAFHSTADSANQSLLVYGRRLARRNEDPTHPFGYGRERYFWPFVVSFLIFGIGAGGSLLKAWNGLQDPKPIENPLWAFGILGVALLLDGASWTNAIRQARKDKTGSWWEYIRDARSPEVPLVLLEDTAAVTGLGFAFLGIGLTVITGNGVYDALGSAVIGLLLAGVAWVLSREMKSLLIGEPARPDEEAAIAEAIMEQGEVEELVSLRTLYLGPKDLLVEAKVVMRDGCQSREIALAIDSIERRIRRRVADARLIAIEPDVPREGDPDLPHWVVESEAGTEAEQSGTGTP